MKIERPSRKDQTDESGETARIAGTMAYVG